MSLITGTILSVGFDASTTPVRGFLHCDGSAIDRTIYAGLFKAIGTRWGAGDGIHTFNLPDLRKVSGGADIDNIELYATALSISEKLQTSAHDIPHRPVPYLAIDSPWYQTAGSHYTAWNNNGNEEGLHSSLPVKTVHKTRPLNVYLDYIIYTGVLT